jgi:ABC-type lipoprotein release transport system permease subunit
LPCRSRNKNNEHHDNLRDGENPRKGILKAVGAKNRTILIIFLAEAALIGIAGSLIRKPTGYGISYDLSYLFFGFSPLQQNNVFQALEVERTTIIPVFS